MRLPAVREICPNGVRVRGRSPHYLPPPSARSENTHLPQVTSFLVIRVVAIVVLLKASIDGIVFRKIRLVRNGR
jgi:hypothetical protein